MLGSCLKEKLWQLLTQHGGTHGKTKDSAWHKMLPLVLLPC